MTCAEASILMRKVLDVSLPELYRYIRLSIEEQKICKSYFQPLPFVHEEDLLTSPMQKTKGNAKQCKKWKSYQP